MGFFLNFGEQIDGYDYRVINEREARASAGIMFLLGILSLFSVYLYRTIFWAELFSITFIIEFVVRTFINPKYAPYMLLGSLMVSNQQPDWVDAAPKQFAWRLGLGLGIVMAFYIVFDKISLIRLAICWICLFLLYFESVFGICIGCMLYEKLNLNVNKCPGGVCETTGKQPFEKKKVVFLLVFAVLFLITYNVLQNVKYNDTPKIVIVKSPDK